MFISPIKFLFDKVCEKIYVGHLDKKIKMDVVEPDKIGQKMKNALENEGMLKDLKNADYIIRFAEKIEEQPPEDEEKPEKDTEDNSAENTEEAPEEETPEEETSEKTDSEDSEKEEGEDKEETDDAEEAADDSTEEDADEDKEEASDDTDDKKKKKDDEDDEINESVKVEDLTSSMVSQPKKTKTSNNSSKSKQDKSTKKSSECKGKTEDDKKCKKCKDKCENKEDKEEITEAETQATGDDLKLRVQKTLATVFNADKDKIELVDVKDCIPGYNVYYYKISFKDTNDKGSEKPKESSEN